MKNVYKTLYNKIVVKNSLPKKNWDAPPWIENAPLGEAKGGIGPTLR